MPLYFAYGANMDIADMAKRAPNSRPLGLARLPRHRFIIMKDGYASVVRDARLSVHGLLWDLALADLPPLDRFEGLDRGLYVKINQPVILEAALAEAIPGALAGEGDKEVAGAKTPSVEAKKTPVGAKRALVYVAASSEPGKPRPGYLEAILVAAAEIGLPSAYRKALAGWSGSGAITPAAGVTPTRAAPAKPRTSLRGARATDTWRWDG